MNAKLTLITTGLTALIALGATAANAERTGGGWGCPTCGLGNGVELNGFQWNGFQANRFRLNNLTPGMIAAPAEADTANVSAFAHGGRLVLRHAPAASFPQSKGEPNR